MKMANRGTVTSVDGGGPSHVDKFHAPLAYYDGTPYDDPLLRVCTEATTTTTTTKNINNNIYSFCFGNQP